MPTQFVALNRGKIAFLFFPKHNKTCSVYHRIAGELMLVDTSMCQEDVECMMLDLAEQGFDVTY